MMTIFIETERLLLRELLPTDVEGMFELDADAEVHRYLGNQPVKTREQAGEVIAFIRRQYVENGIGRWALIEKNTGAFLGWSGLKLVKELTNGHIDYYDLGYRLMKKHWGKGYATESARATVAYGFNELQLPAIYGMADVDNQASRHVLQKAGLEYVETFDLNGTPHAWYQVLRVEDPGKPQDNPEMTLR